MTAFSEDEVHFLVLTTEKRKAAFKVPREETSKNVSSSFTTCLVAVGVRQTFSPCLVAVGVKQTPVINI